MKKRLLSVLLLLCLALPTLALAQDPSRDCFSPGLEALEEAAGAQGIELTAGFAPEAMISANKSAMSVLKAMFARAQVVYRTDGEQESAQLLWDDMPLADFALARGEDGVRLSGSTLPFAIGAGDEAALYAALGMNAGLAQIVAGSAQLPSGMAATLALPTKSGEMTLTQSTLDALAAKADMQGLLGLRVTQPIDIAWTVDADGVFERASVKGAIALPGEDEPYVIAATLRGSKTKVSCEAEWTRDKKNTMSLSVSVTRTDSAATRSKDASTTLDARVKLTGKLDGYARALNITLKGTNTWVRAEDTGVLSEQISQTLKIGYTDKRPGMDKRNLSDIGLQVKDKGSVQSGGEADAKATFTTGIELSLGGYTLLEGTLEARMRALTDTETVIPPEPEAAQATLAEAIPEEGTPDEATMEERTLEEMDAQSLTQVRDALAQGMNAMMRTIYPTLSQGVQETMHQGL